MDACYRWAREMGDPLTGFYPECMPGSDCYLKRGGDNTVEICEVADMVVLALKLTQAGLGDYWDDVDRWTRNMLSEGQFCRERVLESVPGSYFNAEPQQEDPYAVRENVRERSVGSFFGWMRANDGIRVDSTPDGKRMSPKNIMHCCTGNGSRTLYYIWDSIVTEEGKDVRVNLLLNRASSWLDVESYLPVDGKVVLRIKEGCDVRVRLPEWTDPGSWAVSVQGRTLKVRAEGPWLALTGLESGEEVTLSFPLPTRVVHKVLGGYPYKLTLRGSNVIAIDPPGSAYPLYQDPGTGRLVKKSRFTSRIRDLVW